MPQQMPHLASELEAAGIGLNPAALSTPGSGLLAAVVQVSPGCSGSFVSPDGLILTNHHCVQQALQYNSRPDRDLMKLGYVAARKEDELWNGPLARVYITTAMRDVTDAITGGIPSTATERQRYDLINEREKKIVAGCERPAGVRCFVGSYFGGLQYWLTVQQEIRDVRLVYAPPAAIGNFGGETDNWMWPRHAADFALYRAWVAPDGSSADHGPANVPYRAPHHLKVSSSGAGEGDAVLILGYPGRTSRFRSSGEIERVLRSDFPRSIRYTAEVLSILEAAGAQDEEARLKNAASLNRYANNLKYMRGVLATLSPETVRERKVSDEALVTAKGDRVLERMGEIDQRYALTAERDSAFYWMVRGSKLMNQAVVITRYAMERPKKDADRLWGFQDRDVPQIRESIERMQATYDPATERALLRYFLAEAASLPEAQRLPAINAALAATGREGVEQQVDAFLADAMARTRLHDLEARREMFRSSAEALRRRRDPLLNLAAALMPTMMEIRRRDEEAFAAMSALRPRYMERLTEARGEKVYSDANGGLRISLGRVEGYEPKDGVRYGAFTSLPGLVEKTRRGGAWESDGALMEAIEERRFGRWVDGRLNSVPVNFVSTNDSTGGSSGSPVVDRSGAIVGVAFDGNYEALGSDFLYDRDRSRSINLDVRYMLWLMETVIPAPHLVRELGVEPGSATASCH
jgi:hypothetical protein